MDNRKKILGLAVAVAVVVVIVVVAVMIFMKRPRGVTSNTGNTLSTELQTRAAVPDNVVVPDTNSQNVPAEIAKPVEVAPSNTNGAAYRDYNIKIDAGAFTPDTVISQVGDTVNVNFTAVDRDYDIVQPDYGLKYTVKKGQTTRAQFTGTAAGKFTFYCASCGGPAKGPVGYFVIANK